MFCAIAHIPEEVIIAIRHLRVPGRSPRRLHTLCRGTILVFPLLNAAITQEGADDDGVGDGSGPKNLTRRPHCAILLPAVVGNDGLDAVSCNGHEDRGQTEQADQLDLALQREGR